MDRREVVRTYMLLAGLYTLAASLIWSVNTLFLLEAGLSLTEVFAANAAFSAGMVLFEIPTGVVADTLGRRASYLSSLVVLAATTFLYLLMASTGQGVVAFVVVSLFIGLGFTFYSGALEAWLVDALDAAGGGDLDAVFARGQQATGVAMLVGTVGGGVLGQFDLAVPFVARGLLLVALIAVALPRMRDVGFTRQALTARELPAALSRQARVGITYGWNRPGLRALMLTSAVRSGFLFWGFYAAQPYLLDLLERDAVWLVGAVTAGLSVATVLGNQLVHALTRTCRRRTSLLAGGTVGLAGGALLMGSIEHIAAAIVGYLVMGAALGVIEPVHHAYVNSVTTSEHRATVLSVDSMIGSTGGTGGQVGLGALSDARTIPAGYLVGGAATLLALPLLWSVRRVAGIGDEVAGRVAPESCAAAGLPGIAQVDSVTTTEAVAAAGGTV